MIHVSDIEKRLKDNPEPIEVKEIRENIIKSFSKLEFIEDGHKYYVHNDDGSMTELHSVSHVCHLFSPYVNWDEICENKAKKMGIPYDELKRQWRENNLRSTNNGTKTHFFGENMMLFIQGRFDEIDSSIKNQIEDGFFVPYGKKEEAISKFYEDILKIDNFYPVMAEAKIYTGINDTLNLNENFSGTFDMLFAFKHNGKFKLSILDFKGLPLNTPIATKEGWKNMGDISVGDEVFDKDGKICKVLHTSKIHHKPCLKIKFDSGEEIICDEDHRWEISFLKNRMVSLKKEKYFENKVMTAKEIKEYMSNINRKDSRLIPKILLSKPIECEEKHLPIHPYVFGVWLGDGNNADGKITNMYDDIWSEIEKCGYTIGKDVSQGSSGKATTRTIFGLTHELRLLGCLHNKHIPDVFLRSSYEQRLDILKGLMDADGCYNKKRKRYVISTTRENQVDFSVKLLSSLGIKATVTPYIIKLKDKNKKINGYYINFTTDIYPFKIRKIKVEKPTRNKHLFRNIISIEDTETVETKCIEVDSPSHTFCCGYNMLVTHNTNKVLENDFNRNKGNMLLPPFEDLVDEAKSNYSIQLSCYQMGIEQLGYEVVDRKLIWLKDDGTYEKVSTPNLTDKLKLVL